MHNESQIKTMTAGLKEFGKLETAYCVRAIKPHPTLPSGEPEYFYWEGGKSFSRERGKAKTYQTFGRANNAAAKLFNSKEFPDFVAIIPYHDRKDDYVVDDDSGNDDDDILSY